MSASSHQSEKGSAVKSGSVAPPRPKHVEAVPLEVLAQRAGAELVAGPEHAGVSVTGVTLQAQQALAGDLFAGVAGSRAHGADFTGTAVAGGAVAIVTDAEGAQRPAVREAGLPLLIHPNPRGVLGSLSALIYGEPSQKLSVLGITGTSGKTTTAYLVDAGLRAAGLTTGLIGTVETRIAGERLPSAFTTPEAPDLQALFAVMVEQGVSHVVMEVSSHALALGRVNGTQFAVGAFTNLSQDHLDFHNDMENYFASKSLLFDGRSQKEVVVIDGEWGRRLVTPDTVTIATAQGSDAHWTPSEITASISGEQTFIAHGPNSKTFTINLPLPGTFNVANALVAAAILDLAGVEPIDIAKGLASVAVPGRMERVDLGQDFTAVVDYAHKPAAVAQSLDALRGRTSGRLITVLGCGGDRDTGKRPLMGEAAAQRSDILIVTDDNPRSEDPAAIRSAMLSGARSAQAHGEILEIGNRQAAIKEAVRLASSGDVVVVAGKGHETGQESHGVVRHFSDREELTAAIGARLGEPDRT